MTTHPVHELNDVIHQRIRLGVMALLSRVDQLEFTFIRDELGTTDGNLARHLEQLKKAGYISSHKQSQPANRTWIRLTQQGKKALQTEVSALRQMLDHIEV